LHTEFTYGPRTFVGTKRDYFPKLKRSVNENQTAFENSVFSLIAFYMEIYVLYTQRARGRTEIHFVCYIF